jgi:hypothetical protein
MQKNIYKRKKKIDKNIEISAFYMACNILKRIQDKASCHMICCDEVGWAPEGHNTNSPRLSVRGLYFPTDNVETCSISGLVSDVPPGHTYPYPELTLSYKFLT